MPKHTNKERRLVKELRHAQREMERLRSSAFVSPATNANPVMSAHAFYHESSRFGIHGGPAPAMAPTFSRDVSRAAFAFAAPLPRKRDAVAHAGEPKNNPAGGRKNPNGMLFFALWQLRWPPRSWLSPLLRPPPCSGRHPPSWCPRPRSGAPGY